MGKSRDSAQRQALLARHLAFDRPRNVLLACAAMVLLCGLVSLALGQDRNWDLRNYHLYNAYAWLNDRLGHDLAAAQLQSYFTPLLDVPYFWMATGWSARGAAFVLGAVHGLAFAFSAAIAWRLLHGHPRRAGLAPLLALAGCCGAAFLSGLGNTMGDNATAVLVLASVWLLLPTPGPSSDEWARGAIAGVMLGAAVGLKLTNAPYAVALALATWTFPPQGISRWKAVAWLAFPAAACLLLVAGPWLWRVWVVFGNPLFPQFNAAFQAPLALPISVADAQWGPNGLGEVLVWPLLFTVDPDRVANSPLPQLIWAVLYLLGLAWLGKWLRERWRRVGATRSSPADPAVGFVLVFFVAGFVLWMLLFGIYRYLVVLEVLAPVLVWLGLQPLWPRAIKPVLVACVLVSVLGWNTWGHADWSDRDFVVEPPRFDHPAVQTTVALIGTEPMAWVVPFLPAELAFVSLASNFPESPAYAGKVRGMIDHRGGPAYAIVAGAVDKRAQRLRRIDATLQSLGLAGRQRDCSRLQWLVERSGFEADILGSPAGNGVDCHLHLPAARRTDVAAANRALVESARRAAQGYGLRLEVGQCSVHAASIGGDALPYQWCPMTLAAR